MSITQGSPLPDVTVTTTQKDTAPQYYTDYLTGLAGAGTKGMEAKVAGYDPLQTQGYGALPGAADAYKKSLTSAEETARSAAGGLDAARIQSFMDPYRTNVVDEMSRLQQQNLQRNVMPTLKAGFVGQGGLGSQRYAGALGQTLAEMQANLTGQQYGALSKGYSEALRAALDEAQLENEVAKTQMGLARGAQEMGLTGAGALTKAGAERQAYEQSVLDAPLKNAVTAAGLLRGYQFPLAREEKRVGPMAGAYGASPLQTATGLISLLGSAAAGTAGDRMLGALRNLRGLLPADLAAVYGMADEVGQGSSAVSTDPNRPVDIFDPNSTFFTNPDAGGG